MADMGPIPQSCDQHFLRIFISFEWVDDEESME